MKMKGPESLTLDEIKRVVCGKWNVTEQEFMGGGQRTETVVLARSMAAYLARIFTNRSIVDIRMWLGHIRQPTFVHWVMKYKTKVDALRSNPSFGNMRTQVTVGYACEDFFLRLGPVAKIPLSDYIDLFRSVI